MAKKSQNITSSNSSTAIIGTPITQNTYGDYMIPPSTGWSIEPRYKINIESKENGYELKYTFHGEDKEYVFEKWTNMIEFLKDNELPTKETIDVCENV